MDGGLSTQQVEVHIRMFPLLVLCVYISTYVAVVYFTCFTCLYLLCVVYFTHCVYCVGSRRSYLPEVRRHQPREGRGEVLQGDSGHGAVVRCVTQHLCVIA